MFLPAGALQEMEPPSSVQNRLSFLLTLVSAQLVARLENHVKLISAFWKVQQASASPSSSSIS
jgi:hypothetical protein